MPITAVTKQLNQHPQQPFLFVDAAQSCGQIAVEDAAAGADIYAFTGHKWACGPEGLGGVARSERVVSEAAPAIVDVLKAPPSKPASRPAKPTLKRCTMRGQSSSRPAERSDWAKRELRRLRRSSRRW